MALTETIKVDQVELTAINTIQVRTATIIEKDGTEIARTLHRHVVSPGDDISNEDPKVQAIANAIWTEEIIAAYQALIANNNII
jgi:urease accessory protein UreE